MLTIGQLAKRAGVSIKRALQVLASNCFGPGVDCPFIDALDTAESIIEEQ